MAWNPETKFGRWLKGVGSSIATGVSNLGNKIVTGVGNAANAAWRGIRHGWKWLTNEGIPMAADYVSKTAFDLNKYQREYDKQEKELEYIRSLPQTQMENLDAAGLNANLIYGSGAAGAAGQYTPNEDKSAGGLAAVEQTLGSFSQVMGMLGQFQQMKAVSAGIDKTKEAARTAALKNDAQEYLNELMGIYTYLPDGRRVVQKSHIDVDPQTGKVVGVGNVTPKLAQIIQGLNKAYMSNAITEEELKSVVTWLAKQREAEYHNTQASTGYLNTQAAYTSEQLRRLMNTWDPNVLRLLDLGESLAGDATQLLTRGIAGKGRRSPNGYYGYGQSFHGYTIR